MEPQAALAQAHQALLAGYAMGLLVRLAGVRARLDDPPQVPPLRQKGA